MMGGVPLPTENAKTRSQRTPAVAKNPRPKPKATSHQKPKNAETQKIGTQPKSLFAKNDGRHSRGEFVWNIQNGVSFGDPKNSSQRMPTFAKKGKTARPKPKKAKTRETETQPKSPYAKDEGVSTDRIRLGCRYSKKVVFSTIPFDSTDVATRIREKRESVFRFPQCSLEDERDVHLRTWLIGIAYRTSFWPLFQLVTRNGCDLWEGFRRATWHSPTVR